MEKLFIRILETFFEALSNINRYHLIMLLCDGMLVYKNTYFPWATVIGASGVVVTIFYEVVNIIFWQSSEINIVFYYFYYSYYDEFVYISQ